MAEPAASLCATGVSVCTLTVFGVNLGLQPAQLVAGAFGAFSAIVLLNAAVSDVGSAWWLTLARRMAFMLASAVVAGYATPVVLLIMSLPEPAQFGIAFTVGGSAQWSLQALIKRVTRTVEGRNEPAPLDK